MQLLVVCARLRLDPRDEERLCALIEQPLDWARVLRLAAWHGLRPLLRRHLEPVATDALRPVLAELWAETEDIARHNAALAAELAAISELFALHGVRALPYKGPTLAAAIYGDVSMREFGDLDILLPRADVRRAGELLTARGYRPEYPLAPAAEAGFLASPAQYHFVLRHERTGLLVELHWKTDRDFAVERDDDSWWAASRAGFAPYELLLVLCLHGTKHYWSSLGWLVDVAELLRSHRHFDWEAINARSRELGCVRRVAVGLRLAQDVLDVRLPDGVNPLAVDSSGLRLARHLAERMLDPDASPLGPWDALRLDMASCERPTQRLRLLGHNVFAPSLVEWSRWPLPRRLAFLYPVLRVGRLGAKYARRALRDPGGEPAK